MSYNSVSYSLHFSPFEVQQFSIEQYYSNLQTLPQQERIKQLQELKEILEFSLSFVYGKLAIEEKAWRDYISTKYFQQLRSDAEEMRQRQIEEHKAFLDSR